MWAPAVRRRARCLRGWRQCNPPPRPGVRQLRHHIGAADGGGAPRIRYRHRAFFVGSDVRKLAGSGLLDYVPISLEEVPRLLTSARLPIDVALLQVSPPDARGFVSLGVSVYLAPAVRGVARRVIAEVNPAMPRTHGESFVHLDRFDALVSVDAPLAEYRHPETGEVAERVARYIASIIEDGSTLQVGLGRVPQRGAAPSD
jgi:acyl-CoA hydrolase